MDTDGSTSILGVNPLYLSLATHVCIMAIVEKQTKKKHIRYMKKKYEKFLKDKQVERWYKNRRRSSMAAADVSLRRLGAFCVQHKTTPTKLVRLSQRKIEDILLDYVDWAENKGYAGSYINNTVKHIKNWCKFNHKKIEADIKVRGKDDTPSLRDKVVPDQEALKRIFIVGTKQKRVCCALMAHAGVREEVIGYYDGKDGLVVGDIVDLEIKDDKISFKNIPAMIVVRPKLNKVGHQYFTFIGEEACRYIKEYLEDRMKKGEEITKASPLVTPKLRMKPFIKSQNVGDAVRSSIRKAGINTTPNLLRSYFDMQLMQAESKGCVIRDYRVFWFSHKGDMENRYTTNRNNLPTHIIDDMREAYKKSQKFLRTDQPAGANTEDLLKEMRREILMVMDFKEKDIEELMSPDLSNDEFKDLLKKKRDSINNDSQQKIISMNIADNYVSRGWKVVMGLPNDKVVVEHN